MRRMPVGDGASLARAGRRLSLGVCIALVTPGVLSAQGEADAAWNEGDFALASRLYEARLADEPWNARALHRLALMKAWDEDFEESLDLFDRLLVEDPANLDAALDRAKILSWSEDLDAARIAYADLAERYPERREPWLGLARVLSWNDQLRSAEAVYESMLEVDPRDVEALAGYARMAAWDGRLAEAESRGRGAVSLHPDNVMLLTGLARTLRWGGRPAAAFPILEQALALAPEHEEARQEMRLSRMSIAPRLGPTATYESDSDQNRIATVWLDQTLWLSWRVGVNVTGYGRTAELDGSGRHGSSYGGMLELRTRVADGWEMNFGAGASGSDLSESGPSLNLRARIATPGRHRAQAFTTFSRRALDITVPLMESGVLIEEWNLGVRGTPLAGWRAEASAGLSDYRGRAPNRRVSGVLAVSRRLAPDWNVGVGLRAFGFEEDVNDGYFDPSLYGLAEVRLGWAPTFGPWHVGLDIAPGLQKVTRGTSAVSAAVRANASLGYEFGLGRVVQLHGGYHTTGLTSFSTGDADYRYVHVALALGWAF